MHQIDTSRAIAIMPAPTAPGTAGFFTDGNPAQGVPATIWPAEYANMLMMELLNVLSTAGITPSKSNYTQVSQAIRRLSQKGVLLTDTGGVNAYTASNAPALAAGDLVSGLAQRVQIVNANTAAATYSPDGLAAKPVLSIGLAALKGGELVAGGIATFQYLVTPTVNSGNGAWILLHCTGATAPGRLLRTIVFTASGTWTPGQNTTSIEVELVGGGGGGGGAQATAGGENTASTGGGGGGYARKFIAGVASPQTVTIGTGGAGSSGNAVGTSGGTSSFGSLLSATGGAGGQGGTTMANAYSSGAAGGIGSLGDVNVAGTASQAAAASASAPGFGTNGGSSMYGAGGLSTVSVNGNPGRGYGSGGSGLLQGANNTIKTGGTGAAGIVIVKEYA